MVRFGINPDVTYLLVGVSNNLRINPRVSGGGFIYTYR